MLSVFPPGRHRIVAAKGHSSDKPVKLASFGVKKKNLQQIKTCYGITNTCHWIVSVSDLLSLKFCCLQGITVYDSFRQMSHSFRECLAKVAVDASFFHLQPANGRNVRVEGNSCKPCLSFSWSGRQSLPCVLLLLCGTISTSRSSKNIVVCKQRLFLRF